MLLKITRLSEFVFLGVVSGFDAGQRDLVKKDWEAGKAGLIHELSSKLDFWNHLPYSLCALGARCEDAARGVVAKCSAEWNACSVERRKQHHAVTKRFLDQGGELRPLLDQFLAGTPLKSLRLLWRCVLHHLKYVLLVERSIEGQHSLMHASFLYAPNASASLLSFQLRMAELDGPMDHKLWLADTCLSILSAERSLISNLKTIVHGMGLSCHPRIEAEFIEHGKSL